MLFPLGNVMAQSDFKVMSVDISQEKTVTVLKLNQEIKSYEGKVTLLTSKNDRKNVMFTALAGTSYRPDFYNEIKAKLHKKYPKLIFGEKSFDEVKQIYLPYTN